MSTQADTETFTSEGIVQDPTIQSWSYHWRSSGRSEATLDNMARELRRFREYLDGPIETATRADCEAFLAERVIVSIYSANYAWRALRSLFSFLAQEDGTANPVIHTTAPRIPEPSTKVVTKDEYIAMLRVRMGPGFERRRDFAILQMLWATGLRRSELARLHVTDIDCEAQHLVVRKSKTGRPRVVPISAPATKALLSYLRRRALHVHAGRPELWLSPKGALTSDGVRQVIERTARAAGVNVSAHQFRRSLAERWLTAGGSQTSLMAVAGWTTATMPGRYTRSVAGAVADAEYRRIFS